MKEIKVRVNLPKNLAHGTLIWIYASNKKVFHSSKRFDAVEFTEHDSNFLGEIEEICPAKNHQRSALLGLLKKSDRVYGIYLNEQDGQTNHKNETKKAEVLFFATWEDIENYTEEYFEEYDQLAEKREVEDSRRRKAKSEWLERGRRFLKSNDVSTKEV